MADYEPGFYIGASIDDSNSQPMRPEGVIPHRLLRLGDQSAEVVEWLTMSGRDLGILGRQLEDGLRYRDMMRRLGLKP